MSKDIKSKLKLFPNNLRFITEHFTIKYIYKKHIILLTVIASVLITLTILVVVLDLSNNYIRNQKYTNEREGIQREVVFWESVIQKYPDYRDAYYTLAVLNYRLKDIDKSRENLEKSLRIDPNFKEGNDFKKYFKN